MTTRATLIAAGVARLRAAGVPGAERDARLLYRWAADLSGAGLQAGLSEVPAISEVSRFETAIEARAARRPVSHITGMREFWGRSFKVTPEVLDPRPETETLVVEALQRRPTRILDLGTGSGCILLSLLADLPTAHGVGLDISSAAIDTASENAATLGVSDRAQFLQGDWSDTPPGPFDLVVSNPPYLTEAELKSSQPELSYEPGQALSPGGDGLGAYRALAAPARQVLVPGGAILLEIGSEQARSVMEIMKKSGFERTHVVKDLDGRDRVISAQKATNS